MLAVLLDQQAAHGRGPRPAFLEAYGPISEEQLLRARVLAFSVSAALALYAQAENLPSVTREAHEGLARASR